MDYSLVLPAFIAGILTFLAPCTLPLVPGYLGFISGVSVSDLQKGKAIEGARRKIFFNGLLYVLGFSIVFILLGTVFSVGGLALAKYRLWLGRIGGLVVIFFGLYMMGVLKLPFLNRMFNVEKRFQSSSLRPGQPLSAFVFGMTFAFGWTPCVGPVLGTVLVLASTSTTILQGGFLLSVFSLGLAIPFLAIALGIGHATEYIRKMTKFLHVISIIGGVFLVFLGILLLTNNLVVWNSFFYDLLGFINYDALLDYL
jgi:cytochrome c-type biogenesis protein